MSEDSTSHAEEVEEIAYHDKERQPGAGPLRVDEPFKLREDMYSLLFITQLKPLYKTFIDKAEAERKDTLEVLLE